MNYVEIYADDEGVSHFRDVSIKLAEGVVAPPALPLNLSEFRPASEVGFITIPPGWVGGWHRPPTDGYIIVLEGEVQIEVGDGQASVVVETVERPGGLVHRGTWKDRVVGQPRVLMFSAASGA